MSIPEFSLEGKNAIVIAGSRGIGKGIAMAMADAGANVAVTGFTNKYVEGTAKEIEAMGRKSAALTVDATHGEDMEFLAQQVIAEFGAIDIVINAAGDSIRKPVIALPGGELEGMTSQEWHDIVNINLTEAFEGCRVFGPHMVKRGSGTVINVSSFAARKASVNLSAYGAGKAALTRFTETVALEWAPFGVRVNTIAPGQFPDPDQLTDEQFKQRDEAAAARGVPLARVGRMREVGLMGVYLASDAAAYITGQTFYIDGGLVIA
jgi:NAD(P)-dependent dehydrogenase (short-subunit alcohol dehydrogenase family)